MKKITLLSAIIPLLLFAACASDSEKAQKVAYKYSYAMANYNVADAEKYATPETIETTIEMAYTFLPHIDHNYINSDTPATIEITNIDFSSDTSATASYIKNTPIKHNMEGKLELRKRHGKWLAHNPL